MSEMRCGVKRGETEAETPPPPAQPQFTCGVQLRRKRESCGPGGTFPPGKNGTFLMFQATVAPSAD